MPSSSSDWREATARRFVVVMRGPSAVVIPKDQNFSLNVQSPNGPFAVRYTTRWIKKGEGEMPGHIWIEVSGNAPSLEEALEPFAQVGLMAIPLLATSANAAIGHIDIELGFENTPGRSERDFFQSYVPGEANRPHSARIIDLSLASMLAAAVSKSEHQDRLMRAMAQYHLALDNWDIGSSILAVAHLWMAVEALTKARIRTELQRHGLKDEDQLAQQLGGEKRQLDATVRRKLVFQNDEDCYREALAASDAFEHSFKNPGDLRAPTNAVRHSTSRYVRAEIFALASLDEKSRHKLSSAPFDKPLGPRPLAKYIRGKLLGSGENLAKAGNAYPILIWKSGGTAKDGGANGKRQLQMTESFSAELAEGISFKPERVEVWEPC